MKIAVTGGAGFIGHHLVPVLTAQRHDVVVLDNLHRGSFERPGLEGATLIYGDIREARDCERAFEGCDAVIHLAAQSNVMGSQENPDYTFATNVTGTWNVLQAASLAGVQRLIFASSREVYGEPTQVPVPETASFRPHNVYGATKVAGEALVTPATERGPNVTVFRLANVIGSGDSGRVVPLWLGAVREGRPLVLYGGNQVLDLVPVDFVADLLARTAAGELAPAGPVNVGSGTGTPLRALAAHILELAGAPADALEVRPPRGPEITRFVADTAVLRSLPGVEPPSEPLKCIRLDW